MEGDFKPALIIDDCNESRFELNNGEGPKESIGFPVCTSLSNLLNKLEVESNDNHFKNNSFILI